MTRLSPAVAAAGLVTLLYAGLLFLWPVTAHTPLTGAAVSCGSVAFPSQSVPGGGARSVIARFEATAGDTCDNARNARSADAGWAVLVGVLCLGATGVLVAVSAPSDGDSASEPEPAVV